MSNKLLGHVHCGNQKIPVKLSDTLIEDHQATGLWSSDTSGRYQVQLQSGMTVESTGEVFLHELIEMVNDLYDLNLSHNKIQTIGMALAQALNCKLAPNGRLSVHMRK